MTTSYCAQHPEEMNYLYCYNCKIVTCVACRVSKHIKHHCVHIKESAEQFRKQLDDDIEKVTSCAQHSRDKLRQLERDNAGFLTNLAAIQQAISAACERLNHLLNSHLRLLMEELDTIKIKSLKELESKRGDLERQCTIVENFKQYCEEMKEKGTACDISRAANDLHTRSAELINAQELHIRQQLDRVELTFTPSSTLTSATNLIGAINSRGLRAEDFITKAKVLRTIQCSGWVRGIAQLGSELFVCTHNSLQIAVYDLNSNMQKESRHVIVPDMKQPISIEACTQYNCLYISDNGLKCMHRVDLSNTSCSTWSLNAEPRGVSLTRAFNLLVTLPRSIEEYTTTGSLIRSIKLDTSLENPQHSIELSSCQFVVCHSGSSENRVCVVDTSGRVVHAYSGSPGLSTDQLGGPFRLAVDTHGYVFVVDFINDRVQVLSPTLMRLGDVTTPGYQLRQPYSLHLDELNGRLYVGEWTQSRSRVLVLSTE